MSFSSMRRPLPSQYISHWLVAVLAEVPGPHESCRGGGGVGEGGGGGRGDGGGGGGDGGGEGGEGEAGGGGRQIRSRTAIWHDVSEL